MSHIYQDKRGELSHSTNLKRLGYKMFSRWSSEFEHAQHVIYRIILDPSAYGFGTLSSTCAEELWVEIGSSFKEAP